MLGLETKSERGLRSHSNQEKRGAALMSVLIVFIGVFGVMYATVAMSANEARSSRRSMDQVRAKYLAESGFERGMHFLQTAIDLNSAFDPLGGLQALFPGGNPITPYTSEAVMDGASQVGAYSVSLALVGQTPTSVTIQIDSTGYLPEGPATLADGESLGEWDAISVTVSYSIEPSEVFDYAYFINNWGWFYGNTIFANGNVRSNGQFDVAGYHPTVTGQPKYDSVDWNGTNSTLSGYQDDNGDGLTDGNDGGVWSGWDIVAAQNLQGNGGNASNQHEFAGSVDMPNLTDLSSYETRATLDGSSISIGGSTVSDAVYGDDAGETGNLYLHGTAANPIMLDGPLVARGDVIISGYVSGQGAIYAGGNVYVPDSVQYVDPPLTARPVDGTTAETEAWLDTNWDKDFLGLFARENVVVGDHTHGTWRYYVSNWMASSLNQSAEDAGEDGVPNTIDGMDGVAGTADDDVLEGDGTWTVETYTQAQADAGLIPAGLNVGDTVPGSGEDIDGDGIYDGTTTLADIDLKHSLNTTNWGGNMPASGIANYRDIATLYANHIDAVIYTNHSFCYTVLGSQPAVINGALVSRNENIVYGTPSISINYDDRLLGGAAGMAGDLLPQVMQPPTIVRWQHLDRDPNRYIGVAP